MAAENEIELLVTTKVDRPTLASNIKLLNKSYSDLEKQLRKEVTTTFDLRTTKGKQAAKEAGNNAKLIKKEMSKISIELQEQKTTLASVIKLEAQRVSGLLKHLDAFDKMSKSIRLQHKGQNVYQEKVLAKKREEQALEKTLTKEYANQVKYYKQLEIASAKTAKSEKRSLGRIKARNSGFNQMYKNAQHLLNTNKADLAIHERITAENRKQAELAYKINKARKTTGTGRSMARGTGTANGKEDFFGTMFGTGGTSFGHKIATTAQYATAGSGIYAVATAFRSVIEESVRFDNALYNNMAVLEATSTQARMLAETSRDIVAAYGGTIEATDKTILTLGRAGVAIQDLAKATTVVSQLSAITGDTLEDTSTVVSSFITNFKDAGVSVEELGNKLGFMANESKMSTKDLGTFANFGLQTAKSIGLTVDAIGGLATALSRMGISASTIGTQMQKLDFVFRGSQKEVKEFWAIVNANSDTEFIQSEYLDRLRGTAEESNQAMIDFIKTVSSLDDTGFDQATEGMNIRLKNFLTAVHKGGPIMEHYITNIQKAADINVQASISAQGITKIWERLSAAFTTAANGAVTYAADVALSRKEVLSYNDDLVEQKKIADDLVDSMVDLKVGTTEYTEAEKKLAVSTAKITGLRKKLADYNKETEEGLTSFVDKSLAAVKILGTMAAAYSLTTLATTAYTGSTILAIAATGRLTVMQIAAIRTMRIFNAVAKLNPIVLAITAAVGAYMILNEAIDENQARLNKVHETHKKITDELIRQQQTEKNLAAARKGGLTAAIGNLESMLERLQDKAKDDSSEALRTQIGSIIKEIKYYQDLLKVMEPDEAKAKDLDLRNSKDLAYKHKIAQLDAAIAGKAMDKLKILKDQLVIDKLILKEAEGLTKPEDKLRATREATIAMKRTELEIFKEVNRERLKALKLSMKIASAEASIDPYAKLINWRKQHIEEAKGDAKQLLAIDVAYDAQLEALNNKKIERYDKDVVAADKALKRKQANHAIMMSRINEREAKVQEELLRKADKYQTKQEAIASKYRLRYKSLDKEIARVKHLNLLMGDHNEELDHLKKIREDIEQLELRELENASLYQSIMIDTIDIMHDGFSEFFDFSKDGFLDLGKLGKDVLGNLGSAVGSNISSSITDTLLNTFTGGGGTTASGISGSILNVVTSSLGIPSAAGGTSDGGGSSLLDVASGVSSAYTLYGLVTKGIAAPFLSASASLGGIASTLTGIGASMSTAAGTAAVSAAAQAGIPAAQWAAIQNAAAAGGLGGAATTAGGFFAGGANVLGGGGLTGMSGATLAGGIATAGLAGGAAGYAIGSLGDLLFGAETKAGIGGAFGGAAGALAGAGSLLGPLGTIGGALVGAILGSVVGGIFGTTKVKGSGLFAGEAITADSLDSLVSYIDYKKKSWFKSKSWTDYKELGSDTKDQIGGIFKSYDYLLSQLGEFDKISVAAGKYKGVSIQDAIAKSMLSSFIGIEQTVSKLESVWGDWGESLTETVLKTVENQDFTEIYGVWVKYAEEVDKSVGEALSEAFSKLVGTTRDWTMYTFGLNNDTLGGLSYQADYLAADFKNLENMMGITGVTADNYLDMMNKSLKEDFTPENLQSWEALGESFKASEGAVRALKQAMDELELGYTSLQRSFALGVAGLSNTGMGTAQLNLEYATQDIARLSGELDVTGVNLGNFSERLADVHDALTPEELQSWNAFGDALLRAGQAQKALQEITKASNQEQIEIIKATNQVQLDSLNLFYDGITDSIKELTDVVGSLQDIMNKLRLSLDPTLAIGDFYRSMEETLKLMGSGDFEAYTESLDKTIKASSALFETSYFTSAVAQDYAQGVAYNQFESMEVSALTQIDYLMMIEANTKNQITALENLPSPFEALVNQMYQEVLGREADIEGLKYWVEELTSGNLSFANLDDALVAAGLENLEAINLGVVEFAEGSTEALVKAAYEEVLGRIPDIEGFEYWVDELKENNLAISDLTIAIANAGVTSTGVATDIASASTWLDSTTTASTTPVTSTTTTSYTPDTTELSAVASTGISIAGGGYIYPESYAPPLSSVDTSSMTSTEQFTYGQINGFAGGGYTGDLGISDVAGFVHGQEYVVNARTTKDLGLNGSSGVFEDILEELADMRKLQVKQTANSNRQLSALRGLLDETLRQGED